jgi:hypothetical protein
MLTVEKFKVMLARSDRSDSLLAALDANFYIVGNGGMGTSVSAPAENYLPEIKEYVIAMINSGGLIKDENKDFCLIGI